MVAASQPRSSSGYWGGSATGSASTGSAAGSRSTSSTSTSAAGNPASISARSSARRSARLGAASGPQRRCVGIDDPIGHLADQQQGRVRHAAPGREPALGEAAGVQQRQPFGPPLDGQPGEPGDVGRQRRGAQDVAHPGVDLVVVDGRLLDERPAGPLPGLPARAVSARAGGPGQQRTHRRHVVQHPGRPVDGQPDVPGDVVERLGPARIVGPAAGRPVGQGERTAILQPGDDVDERRPIGAPGGVQAQPADPVGVPGHHLGQLGQGHLDAGPPDRGQHQSQVGVATSVERPPGSGGGRLTRIELVGGADQPGRGGRQLQPVAHGLGQVRPQLRRPPADQRQGLRVGIALADQRVPQHGAEGALVVGQLDVGHLGGEALTHRTAPTRSTGTASSGCGGDRCPAERGDGEPNPVQVQPTTHGAHRADTGVRGEHQPHPVGRTGGAHRGPHRHPGPQRAVEQGEQHHRLGLGQLPPVRPARGQLFGGRSLRRGPGELLLLQPAPGAVVALDGRGPARRSRPTGLDQRAGHLHRRGLPPGAAGRDQLRVLVRDADVTRRAQPEHRAEERVRSGVGRRVREPGRQVTQLRLPAHPAAAGLGDPPQHGQHVADRGHRGLLQPVRLGGRLVGAEPGDQPGPALPPVGQPVHRGAEEPVVGLGGQFQHPLDAGGRDGERGRVQPRAVAQQLGVELAHVGQQRILVGEEHLGPVVGGPRQLAEQQVEARRPLRHVRQRPIEPGQLAVGLLGVTGGAGRGQRVQIGQDVREHQARQRGVLQPGGQHLLDGLVGAEPGIGELVDRVPVPVLLHRGGARGVLPAVQVAPVHQRVEGGGEILRSRALGMLGGQLGQLHRDVRGVQQDLVVGPGPVERPQDPQVDEPLVGRQEVEQPHPVVERERIDPERRAEPLGHPPPPVARPRV